MSARFACCLAVSLLATSAYAGAHARDSFNAQAQLLNLPLFWAADTNGNGQPDPTEVAVDITAEWSDYVHKGAFTAKGKAAVEAALKGAPAPADDRQKKVYEDLNGGRRILVSLDLSGAPKADQQVAKHILAASRIIEQVHAKQLGVADLKAEVAPDAASQALFWRNLGPWCVKANLEGDKACTALKAPKPKISGLYPAELQKDPDFCKTLAAHKDRKALMNQFSVVTGTKGALKAVPYSVFYRTELTAIAKELTAAAAALPADEGAFKAYLEAAAKAFGDNNWFAADEKWAAMNAKNSKWYLRIGPDETYFEPCNEKAGFHVSFARINQGSVEWQRKLEPVKQQMERAFAKLSGAPYNERKVSFHLPDFIDIILNAGDARNPIGATIGQSLPNWGPVANEGRGRTVAMTNLYEDPDSKASLRTRVESIFCSASMTHYTDASAPGIMSTVLHEAAHNLGPSAEYKVEGKTDREVFGGPLAATLEEFKAQMASLYFADWLVGRRLITREFADQAHFNDIVWSFGQIARGMYTAEGRTKPYAHLSAIMSGTLLKRGVLNWHPERKAHNGQDVGCFTVQMSQFPKAGKALLGTAAGIKARGDKSAAEALKKEFVDADSPWKALRQEIKKRWSRAPKGSFVYSIKF